MLYSGIACSVFALSIQVNAAESQFILPNGLRVMLEERHDLPLLRLELRTGWPSSELGGQEWAVFALAQAMEKGGAARMSARTFARSLEESTIRLKWRHGENYLGWSLLSDSRNQEVAFEHLANAVFRSDLDGEGLEAGKLNLANRLVLYRRLVRPERSVLAIQGDLNMQQVRQLTILHLGTWAPATALVPPPEPLPVLPAKKAGSRVVSRLSVLEPRELAAHLLLAYLLSREAGKAGIALEARREDGQPGSISYDPSAAQWVKELCQRGFSSADLKDAKQALSFERISMVLHPEVQLAHRAQTALIGNPGAYLDKVSLEELNKALNVRLGSN